jgi:hypothetical protein
MLKLRYGKRYRSRRGQETTPLIPTPDPIPAGQTFAGRFTDEKGGLRTWSPDGSSAGTGKEVDSDLVEEIK